MCCVASLDVGVSAPACVAVCPQYMLQGSRHKYASLKQTCLLPSCLLPSSRHVCFLETGMSASLEACTFGGEILLGTTPTDGPPSPPLKTHMICSMPRTRVYQGRGAQACLWRCCRRGHGLDDTNAPLWGMWRRFMCLCVCVSMRVVDSRRTTPQRWQCCPTRAHKSSRC